MQNDIESENKKVQILLKEKSELEKQISNNNGDLMKEIEEKNQTILDFDLENKRLKKWKPNKDFLSNPEIEFELPNYQVNYKIILSGNKKILISYF